MQLQAIRAKITAQINQHQWNYEAIRRDIGFDTGLDIGTVDEDNNPQPWVPAEPMTATVAEAEAGTDGRKVLTPAGWTEVNDRTVSPLATKVQDKLNTRRNISEPLSEEELADTRPAHHPKRPIRTGVDVPLTEEQKAMTIEPDLPENLSADQREKLARGEPVLHSGDDNIVLQEPMNLVYMNPRSIITDPLELFAQQHKRLADLGHEIDFDSGWGSPRKGYKQLTQSKRGTVGLKVSTNTTGALLAIRTEHDGDGRVTTSVMFERNGSVELAGRNGIEVVQDMEVIMDFFNATLRQK